MDGPLPTMPPPTPMGKPPPPPPPPPMTGLAPHAWEAYVAAGPARAEGAPCDGCRVSKVKCDRKRPCSRCVRLQHTCRPARKRPRSGTAAAANGQHTAALSTTENGARGGAKAAGGLLCHGEQLVRTLTGQLSGRELAEAMVEAVGRLAQDGRVDRARARSTL